VFTGIIEQVGKLKAIKEEGANLRLTIEADFTSELKIDQSVAHNGVCLTVEKLDENSYEVVAIQETLEKTNLSNLKAGEAVTLERCMRMNARLDGHIVQGHVDGKATVKNSIEENGSWVFEFSLDKPSKLIVEKGSICVNGVSLTAFSVSDEGFSVAIIPYTYEHTTFNALRKNQKVNLEFDIVGKYIQRMIQK
jgi:riboflavin synthase